MPRKPDARPAGTGRLRTSAVRPLAEEPPATRTAVTSARGPATAISTKAAEASPTKRRASSSVAANAGPIPFGRASDPDAAALDALATDLAAAGRRARNRRAQVANGRPDPIFSEALRSRLEAVVEARSVPARSSSASLQAPSAVGSARSIPVVALAPDMTTGPLTRPRPSAQSNALRQRTGASRKWVALGAGAMVLALAAAGLLVGRLTPAAANKVGDAAGATLIRGGARQPLVTGAALAVGDEIQVAADGHATLDLGSSQTRLAGGADLRLNLLSGSSDQLDLLAGRAYHRVVLASGGSYSVVTGPYTWTATGTAFDLDRTPGSSGGEQVTLLALEHAVSIDGPGVHRQIPEGSSATVLFGGSGSAGLTVGPIPTSAFSDPWLIDNAKTDESLGYPIGALAGVALAPNDTPLPSPSPSPSPSDSPSDGPSASPSVAPSDSPSDSPSPSPTPGATPSPSPSPSPTPTATPKPTFNLTGLSCPGGVVLSWTKYTGAGFVKYETRRSGIPVASATTFGQNITSGYDPIGSTTGSYQTLALGAGGKVLAASPVKSIFGRPQEYLGPLSLTPDNLNFVWVATRVFGPGCFSAYWIQYYTSIDLTVHRIVVTAANQGNWPVPNVGWTGGQSLTFTVSAVRTTTLGDLVVGYSNPVTYVQP